MRAIPPSRQNFYTGGSLNRAGHLRGDDAWIAAALGDPASRFVLFQQGRALLAGSEEGAARIAYAARPIADAPWVFLGLQDGIPVFAGDLTGLDPPAGLSELGQFAELRLSAASLNADDATILATARAMLHWRRQTKFCAVCGHAVQPVRAGYVMHCGGCGTEYFPRTDPAVIMLVSRNGKVLLGQSLNFPPERNFYSTLAGFVEPGETLEDAVRREVFEETGIRIGAVQYHSGQPWPFPASLMLGFYGEGLNDEIVLDRTEMRDARWFTREELADCRRLGFSLPPPQSIARQLLEDWLAAPGP